MIKRNIIFLMLIIVVTLFFTGCFESSSNEDEDDTKNFDLFVGKWEVDVDKSIFLDEDYVTEEETWTFYNETESAKKVQPVYYILDFEIKDVNGKYHNHTCFWELTDRGIYITAGYDYKYKFSDDNTHLVLTSIGEEEYHKYVLDKI